MPQEFARSGIKVRFPDNWLIEVDETEDGWSATIQSPDTAFLMLNHYPDDYEPMELADMALEAMRESYPDLEAEEIVETLNEKPVIGYDVNFIALDLTNTCWIRSLIGLEGNLLFMSQCTDQELETYGSTLREIVESLTFEDED
ncbi:MAG: hypothetical protein K8T89_18675 [Planctomycetes bacterium]|nr:hypothetical protein [Planctomycetota bacterium]